ncbi:MAG TPA: ATP-binding protein [Myxococcaceae bacterium]|nr:ATP-binding protein [Myxococcaceae bacterium]
MLARVQAGLVLLAGGVVLSAWLLDTPVFGLLRPGLPIMKANAALSFMLAGASLLFLCSSRAGVLSRRIGQLLGGLVMLLSGLTLAEYLFGVDLGIDQLLVRERPQEGLPGMPGRMTLNTTVGFVFLGLALVLLGRSRPGRGWYAQVLASLTGVIALVGLASYLYGQYEFSGLARYAQMALLTTVCFLLLASAIFEARADWGFMKVVTRAGLGGVLARWLLPPAFLVPLLLCGVMLAGYRAEFFTLPLAVALIAVGNVVVFSVLAWGAAFALDREETRRLRAEEERMGLVVREQAARAEAAAQLRERSRAEAAEQEASALAADWRFLSEVGAALSTSLEESATLATLAQRAVPRLGDWCVVDLAEPGERTRQVAQAHVDGARAGPLSLLVEREPGDPLARGSLAHVLHTGRSALHEVLDSPRRLAEVLGVRQAEPLHVLGARSAMVVPLLARGRPFGAVTFVSARPELRFSPADLSLAQELCQRAAVAVENARLFLEAQRAVRTREEVLAVVSHDLKNPLGSLSLSVQLLRRLLPPGEPGERMREHTRAMERSVERMDRLIRDLLDMASLQAGKLKLEPGRYVVEDLVSEGVALLAPLAIQKQVALRVRVEEEGEVRCDRERIFQVLSNLVGNALKFTPEHGEVTVEAVPQGDVVRFSVRDSGPGIAPEALPHLFEPFWQAKGAAREGTGLGLYITRGLVEAHGGGMWVESEPGRGSTFSFTLPRAGPAEERALEPTVH